MYSLDKRKPKNVWEGGKRNGYGTGNLANGAKYVGDYKDDKKNGHGTYTYANGEKYKK